jgi:hypothetical protein
MLRGKDLVRSEPRRRLLSLRTALRKTFSQASGRMGSQLVETREMALEPMHRFCFSRNN